MGPPMVTIGKPSIYGIGIPEIIVRNKFLMDILYQFSDFPSFHGDRIDAGVDWIILDDCPWIALPKRADGLDWQQHDCGLEITRQTWDRAGILSFDHVCPRCQPEYQYVWTHREGLSR